MIPVACNLVAPPSDLDLVLSVRWLLREIPVFQAVSSLSGPLTFF